MDTGWSSGYLSMRSMHMSLGCPFTSALHEPHLPALQFQRTARSGACFCATLCTASSTTMPGALGMEYWTISPPDLSPRKIFRVVVSDMAGSGVDQCLHLRRRGLQRHPFHRHGPVAFAHRQV